MRNRTRYTVRTRSTRHYGTRGTRIECHYGGTHEETNARSSRQTSVARWLSAIARKCARSCHALWASGMALHVECDDTILMERIMGRGASSDESNTRREDDNFHSALKRLRTYHSYHHKTIDWLREQHVPIVNLDCSGSPESVWKQLVAIRKLMRRALKLRRNEKADSSSDPYRTAVF